MLLLSMLIAAPPATAKPIHPETWITTADYPAEAVRERATGIVAFQLTIDSSGKAVNCAITESSNSPVLDAATCPLLLAKARFDPAPDAETLRTYQSHITWQIPRGAGAEAPSTRVDYPPEALRQHLEGTVGFELEISAEGKTTACRVTQSSGHSLLDDATCKLMIERARFNAASDRSGSTTNRQFSSQMTWKLPR